MAFLQASHCEIFPHPYFRQKNGKAKFFDAIVNRYGESASRIWEFKWSGMPITDRSRKNVSTSVRKATAQGEGYGAVMNDPYCHNQTVEILGHASQANRISVVGGSNLDHYARELVRQYEIDSGTDFCVWNEIHEQALQRLEYADGNYIGDRPRRP